MIEFFLAPDFLNLITLANFTFYVAIFLGLLTIRIFSLVNSPDARFQAFSWYIGIAFLTVYLFVNVMLSQISSTGSYSPFLIGSNLYAEIQGQTPWPSEAEIERRLFGSWFVEMWPAYLAGLLVVVVGAFSFAWPTPKWAPGLGIDLVDAKVANLVDTTIRRMILRNLLVNMTLLIVTVIFFDLAQLAQESAEHKSVAAQPNVFQQFSFDKRFFVALGVGPVVLAWAIGRTWRLRYRMLYGDLLQYRPSALRRYVADARAQRGREKPDRGLDPQDGRRHRRPRFSP